jgi:hypothetical protein
VDSEISTTAEKKKGGLDYWGSVNNKQRPGKAEIEYKNTIRFEIW